MIDEFEKILLEATQSVENELLEEDKGWIRLGASQDILDSATLKTVVQKSRIYCARDPMAKQSIRLWTDYSFGTGMSWDTEEESTKKILNTFWDNILNASVLSARGQRKCSDKLLTDGEIFFAIFLSKTPSIRTVDPLEITEIVTDPDDRENPRFYRRVWSDAQSGQHDDYYRSWLNVKGDGVKNSTGQQVTETQEALIYHLAINTIGQRGIPLIYPSLDWITQYRRFLASRISVMLALARFAWRHKVKGGTTAVSSVKAAMEDKTPAAGASLVENEAVDTQQLKTDSGAGQAYQDGRMIKLQICSAVGIPEQYFGDISTGNLATAKTVELPMLKMFQSYQQIWKDTYNDLNNIILEYNNIPEEKRYVDIDFPAIAPEDAVAASQALAQTVMAFPALADSHDVIQQALIVLGINDPGKVIDELTKESGSVNTKLAKALRELKRVIESKK